MPTQKYKYIYGPVPSWRLGSSLGIDPLSREEKICSFGCVYCQVGETDIYTDQREIFVSTEKIIEEIKSLPPLKIDYITFSGKGEPTLAKNLGEMIKEIRKIRKEKVAVITNSSLINRDDVQKDLALSDLVIAKLDASSAKAFLDINKPMRGITFDRVLKGIKEFRGAYNGKLALQIMFIEQNKVYAEDLAAIAREIQPDEVQINTPLRPCEARPLSKEELDVVIRYFDGMNVISVYGSGRKGARPISKEDTLRRRGSYD
ncbi:radical SAM protein [Candidatus Omnitrophota bacterium]